MNLEPEPEPGELFTNETDRHMVSDSGDGMSMGRVGESGGSDVTGVRAGPERMMGVPLTGRIGEPRARTGRPPGPVVGSKVRDSR